MYTEYYVYILKDQDGIIRYVGKTGDYKNRIASHFKKSSNPLVREHINKNWTHDHIICSSDEIEILKIEKNIIEKYKPQLYNIKNFGGISGKYNKNPSVKIKNINTNNVLQFKTQKEAALFLNVHKSTVSYLIKGKKSHISGQWVLENTDPSIININPRKTGFLVDKQERYFKLYDTVENTYIEFKSVTDCANKLKTNTTSISRLKKGSLQSIKNGRYKLSVNNISQYKPIKIYDKLTNTVLQFNKKSEFCKEFNIHSSYASQLSSGKIEHIHNRFELYIS